jgi:D-serine deaminase-like pyridoxal phosphate-dependent protein
MSTLPPSLSDLIGQPVQNIDTPALVVDLDAMNRNLGRMAEFAKKHGLRWRPHAKLHKSVQLARLQIAAGSTRLPKLGGMLWLIPGHCDPTVNLHDVMIGVSGGLRQGTVQSIIRVDGRGALT